MKFEKVIYIRYLPLTKKIFEDFFFQKTINAGVEVEYWDITDLFFKGINGNEDSNGLCSTKIFTNYNELENEIKNVDNFKSLYISIMTVSYEQTKLYSLFKKYNCNIGIFGAVPFPELYGANKSFVSKIPTLLKSPFGVLSKIIKKKRFQNKIFKGEKAFVFNVIFSAGELGYLGIGYYPPELLPATKIVNINYPDYEKALSVADGKAFINDDYILFIDEYLPLHPDIKVVGIRGANPELYYRQLNLFFDKIEAKYNAKVVIAAHPKALRYLQDDYFDGRKVIFNKTAELVRDSQFVVMHDSTSYIYPLYFKKKILFVTSHDIEENAPSTHKNTMSLASSIQAKCIYFDESFDTEPYPVNEMIYGNILRQRFMSSLDSRKKTSDIFIKYLTN